MLTSTGLWVAVGVVALLFIFQRKNLKRLVTAGSAQAGKGMKWLWGIDAVAVYQAEVDKSSEELESAGEGLEKYRTLVTKLERQVATGEQKEVTFTTKIKTLLGEDNENKAAEYAAELQRVRSKLVTDRKQLESYQSTYQDNIKKVNFANQKIKQAKDKVTQLGADLELSKVEAETAKLAQHFNTSTSSIGNGLNEIEEEIQRQIDANRAKGQVIHDLSQDGMDQIDEEEQIQKAQAKELLEQFKTEMKK